MLLKPSSLLAFFNYKSYVNKCQKKPTEESLMNTRKS